MASISEKPGSGAGSVRRAAARKKAPVRTEIAKPSEVEEIVPVAASRPVSTSALLMIGGIRERDINAFLRQLIMLIEAGTPILRSLKTLSQRGQRASVRALVGDIAEYVEAGNPLWQAFDRHPRYFDRVFVNLIKASEASGTLVPVLTRIVDYRERRAIMRRRMMGAMLYPCILLVACVVVVLVLTKLVIPSIEELFVKFETPLPGFTKGFIATTKFLGHTWWMWLAGLVILYIFYKAWYVRSPLRRLFVDRIKLHIPIMGPIVRKNAIVQLSRTFSLLLRSGLPMMTTLDLVRNAITNQAVANTMRDISDSVERGAGIEQPLRQAERIIPPVVTDLLVTGEESGRLDVISEQVAEAYEEEVRVAISALGDMLTPILTLFIGAIVIVMALALFKPLIGMVNSLSASTG